MTPTIHPRRVLAVLASAGMVAAFMHSILIPIQAELPGLLDSTREGAAWVITITLLVSAICTPISGRLGDMFGKRNVVLVLLGLLVAGSLICAVSSTLIPMTVGRGLQGMGMGVIPLGIALLHDTMPPHRLGFSIALVSATLGVGAALGLPFGALITAIGDWHLLFWVSAALCATVFLLCLFIVPASQLRSGGRFDFLGAAGLASFLTAFLLVLSNGNEWGWLSVPTLVCGGTGLILFALWTWYQWRRSAPLIDVRVSVRRPVLMTNLASIAMGFALFASSVAFPQMLQLPVSSGGFGASLLVASFVLMPSGLAMLAMSPIAGRLMDRIGPKALLMIGGATIALTYLAAVLIPPSILSVAIVNAFLGAGIGLGYAAMPSLIMRAVPSSETAAANGLNTLMRALGTTVASAAIATVLAQSAHASAAGDPTPGGFRLALILGGAGATASVALAIFIPRTLRTVSPESTAVESPRRESKETSMTEALYTASATSTGNGRSGNVRSASGHVDFSLAMPVVMGGSGDGTNPEELFAAGYSACFHSALLLVSRQDGVPLTDSAVTSEVGIGPGENGAFGLSVELRVYLPGVEQDVAERLIARAHDVCPYSNATRGNIQVELTAVTTVDAERESVAASS